MKKYLLLLIMVQTGLAWGTDSDTVKIKRWGFSMQAGHAIDARRLWLHTSATATYTVLPDISVGAGAGYDTYPTMNAIPIFGRITYDLFGNKNLLSLQLDYGWSKPRMTREVKEAQYGFAGSKGGRMVAPQLVYNLRYDKVRIGFMIGFKYQKGTLNYRYPINYYYMSSTKPLAQDYNETRITIDKRSPILGLIISWGR